MIAVLLATYNSEKYLCEQIESLLRQTYQDFVVYVRDDCSTDRTPLILEDYAKNYPNKFKIIDNGCKSLRAYGNFVELLKCVEASYYMFCDHDDVWLPNKIEVSMSLMKETEAKSPYIPILVHTDMRVVDQNLITIDESFWHYTKLLPNHVSFQELVCCNSVNGCTILMNVKAKDVSIPHVKNAKMHDMLVAQCVAANDGIVVAVTQPTVLYRQHLDNVVGAHERNSIYYFEKFHDIKKVVKDNIEWWTNSKKIKYYSFFSFLMTKIRVNYLKIMKYKYGKNI